MKHKKGSANMWWIIIGAVVALVVMIVLMVMFTGKSNKLEGGLSSCESKGGVCVANGQGGCPANTLPANAFECASPETTTCCIGSPKDALENKCSQAITDTKGNNWCK